MYDTWADRLMTAFLVALIIGTLLLFGFAGYHFLTPEIIHGSVVRLSVVGSESWAVVKQADGVKRSVQVGGGDYVQLSLGDTCDFNVSTYAASNCKSEAK